MKIAFFFFLIGALYKAAAQFDDNCKGWHVYFRRRSA